MAQGLFAPPPPWRHGTARHKTGRHTEIPTPAPLPIPTPPDPTSNGPLETTTMECQSHTYGPNAFVFLSRAQC